MLNNNSHTSCCHPSHLDSTTNRSRLARRTNRRDQRNGVALIVVLGLIAITLAISYSVMRSQATSFQIQINSQHRISAQETSFAALEIGLRKMRDANWAGANTKFSGRLDDKNTYQVTFTAGDPSLDDQSPDWEDYPYRVTVLATGYSTDPVTGARASHQMQAVVQLVPQYLEPNPASWSELQQFTVYQTATLGLLRVELPARIVGPVRVQGTMLIADQYPNDDSARHRYLEDLEAMRLAGRADMRPFDGPITLELLKQSSLQTLQALSNWLGLTVIDEPSTTIGNDWSQVPAVMTYQIYQGGPVYNVLALPYLLENISLKPDVLTNPLGIFYRSSAVSVYDNVTFRGTVICDTLAFEGQNIKMTPYELPKLFGSNAKLRLPTSVSRNFDVRGAINMRYEGLLMNTSRFHILMGSETVQFDLTGRVISKRIDISERTPWNITDWASQLAEYKAEPKVTRGYFSDWMDKLGRSPTPLINFRPDANPVTYHWGNNIVDSPIFVPKDNNSGLQWDLIDMQDLR